MHLFLQAGVNSRQRSQTRSKGSADCRESSAVGNAFRIGISILQLSDEDSFRNTAEKQIHIMKYELRKILFPSIVGWRHLAGGNGSSRR
jgi:hypothetical protein